MNGFQLGDTVTIINAAGSVHENGDVGTLVGIELFLGSVMYLVDVNGVRQGHYDTDIQKVAN